MLLVLPVLPALKVPLVPLVLLAPKALQVLKVLKVLQVLQVLKVLQAPLALLVKLIHSRELAKAERSPSRALLAELLPSSLHRMAVTLARRFAPTAPSVTKIAMLPLRCPKFKPPAKAKTPALLLLPTVFLATLAVAPTNTSTSAMSATKFQNSSQNFHFKLHSHSRHFIFTKS